MRLFDKRWDAGLHSGLISACDAIQEHQCHRQKQYQMISAHQQQKKQYHRCGNEIQYHHDIPLIHPVRNNAAHRRQQNGRQKSTGRNDSKKCRRACQIQQIQRQRKPYGGIAEQRNDLTDNDQCKVLRKQFLLHPETSSFSVSYLKTADKSGISDNRPSILSVSGTQ